ncbi:MAG TPA: glycoside hydrolase family 3 protein [Verrucomicrobia bacterium]|nr:glycoside hydrolase family 3 protein [Verrucomicrobiales bacterium]HIL55076.1 glycoside hydrolase family 3 protein [Verrucomicrobiota bacterium]
MSSFDVGQLILMGIPGTELKPDTATLIKSIQPGGFIIFGRNIESSDQLRKLTDDLRSISKTEPFITIDQEGGRVSRLRLIGAEPPNAMQLSIKNNPALIKKHGKLTGQLLRLYGFNLNLCPVLDISLDEEADNSLKGRCYGESADQVITNAALFNKAMRSKGILSCGKHFPGYTFTSCDAHEELPTVNRSKDQWELIECAPFRALLPDLDSVMICHTHYPFFDPDDKKKIPASLSYNAITKTLRDQLGYDNGLVITDDLDMGAILNEFGFEETIQKAIIAGNDIVMICHRTEMAEGALTIIDKMPAVSITDSLERIYNTKTKIKSPSEFDLQSAQEIDEQIWNLRVETLGEELANKKSIEDGKRSPVETY